MSHITTIKTKIVLKNEGMLKNSLTSLKTKFPGLTFQQVSPDVIKVRYSPIEVYQKNGNIQFVKNPNTGVWEMQLDHYRCDQEVTAVKDAFFMEYQKTAVSSFFGIAGYMTTTKQEGKNIVLTATKY